MFAANERAQGCLQKKEVHDRLANHSAAVTAYTDVMLLCTSPPFVGVGRVYGRVSAAMIWNIGIHCYNVNVLVVDRPSMLRAAQP